MKAVSHILCDINGEYYFVAAVVEAVVVMELLLKKDIKLLNIF